MCVGHCATEHSDKQLTIQICRLGYQTKRYPVVPDNPSEKKVVKVVGDKITVQQQYSDNTSATKKKLHKQFRMDFRFLRNKQFATCALR